MVDSSNDFSNLVELNIILSNKMPIRSISHFYICFEVYIRCHFCVLCFRLQHVGWSYKK